MKKKILSLVLAICCVFPFAILLTACGEHTHQFAEVWTTSETQHWHECMDKNCGEVKDKANHSWNKGVITTPATETSDGVKTFTCTVCQKTKTESVEYVSTTMTKEQWTKALTFEGINNYSMTTTSPSNSTFLSRHYVDGNKIHFRQDDMVIHRDDGYWSEDWLEIVEDGGNVKYYMYSCTAFNTTIRKKEITISDYMEVLPSATFSMFEYESVTYNSETGKYEASLEVGEESYQFIFGFANGRLDTVSAIMDGITMNMKISYESTSIAMPTAWTWAETNA